MVPGGLFRSRGGVGKGHSTTGKDRLFRLFLLDNPLFTESYSNNKFLYQSSYVPSIVRQMCSLLDGFPDWKWYMPILGEVSDSTSPKRKRKRRTPIFLRKRQPLIRAQPTYAPSSKIKDEERSSKTEPRPIPILSQTRRTRPHSAPNLQDR